MNIFKFLWNDLKTDILCVKETIKRAREGKPIVDQDKLDLFRKEVLSKPGERFKESWPWLIVIIFAFVLGWVMAAGYYQVACNNFIIENYINNITNSYSSMLPYLNR